MSDGKQLPLKAKLVIFTGKKFKHVPPQDTTGARLPLKASMWMVDALTAADGILFHSLMVDGINDW